MLKNVMLTDVSNNEFNRAYRFITEQSTIIKRDYPDLIELVVTLNDRLPKWEKAVKNKEKFRDILYSKQNEGIDPKKWFNRQKSIISSKISRLNKFSRGINAVTKRYITTLSNYFDIKLSEIVEIANEFFSENENEFKLEKTQKSETINIGEVELDALADKGIDYSEILNDDLLPNQLKLMPVYLETKQDDLYKLLLSKTKNQMKIDPKFNVKKLFDNYLDNELYKFEALKIKAEDLTDANDIAKNEAIVEKLNRKFKKIRTIIMPVVNKIHKDLLELEKETKKEVEKEKLERTNDEIERRNNEILRRAKEFLNVTNQKDAEALLKKYNGGGNPKEAISNSIKYLYFLQNKLETLKFNNRDDEKREINKINSSKEEIKKVIEKLKLLNKQDEANREVQEGIKDVTKVAAGAIKKAVEKSGQGVKSTLKSVDNLLSKKIGINK